MPSINFNPAGITALQNFNLAQTNLSRTQSQIATGKRVQSAQDDPAALATSQRLTAQKNGVGVGIENSKAADKMLATADKSLSNMQDIMQSMRQLAVKASNDATTDADRTNYQKQINDYRKELDRIARDTKYKERHLLNGDMKDTVAAKDASATVLTNIAVNESSIQGTKATNLVSELTNHAVTVSKSGNNLDVTFQIKLVANGNSVDAQIFASNQTNTPGVAATPLTTIAGVNASGGKQVDISSVTGYSASGLSFQLNQVDASTDVGKTAVLRITSHDAGVTEDKSVAFQVGANAGEEMTIGVGDMSSTGLRIAKLDVSSSLAAKNSVSMIDDAINRISDERAKIGSLQNRLQVGISNNETYKANLEGALAQEVDVNYAEAVLQQTIDQVKQQASLAMLTQANQSQQAVLGLLQ
ncbi:MAG: flagellin [Candidatus Eremiobacterota bacterium]